MSAEIDGVCYSIEPIPLHLSPFNRYIANLLKQEPKNFAEAELIGVELDKAFSRLLKELSNPMPPKKHQFAVFNAIIELTNETVKSRKEAPHR